MNCAFCAHFLGSSANQAKHLLLSQSGAGSPSETLAISVDPAIAIEAVLGDAGDEPILCQQGCGKITILLPNQLPHRDHLITRFQQFLTTTFQIGFLSLDLLSSFHLL